MRLKFFFAALLGLARLSALGQDYKNEIALKSDNDAYLFVGQDRYYTNGLFLNFRYASNQEKLGDQLNKKIFEFSVGQKMYNPISGHAPNPARQDRPFAAYLYGGAGLDLFYKNESVLKLSAELGTGGPNALGKEAQTLLHDTFRFYDIDGWQYQIQDDFSVNLSAQFTKLLHRSANKKIDLSVETYLNAGTTFSGAGAGVLFRTGRLNQLFNTTYTNSLISNKAKSEKFTKNEFYFYAKPQLNFVAYDATIQGSMFQDDSPITYGIKSLVFAQQLGFDYSTPRFTVGYSIIFKSKEIKSTARAHQYGTIALSYRFGK